MIHFSLAVYLAFFGRDLGPKMCPDNPSTAATVLRVLPPQNGYKAIGTTPQAMMHVWDLQTSTNIGWLYIDDLGKRFAQPMSEKRKAWIPPSAVPVKVSFGDSSATLYELPDTWTLTSPYVLQKC